jgi:hypothetical protein
MLGTNKPYLCLQQWHNSSYKKLALQWLNATFPASAGQVVLRVKFSAGRSAAADAPKSQPAPSPKTLAHMQV